MCSSWKKIITEQQVGIYKIHFISLTKELMVYYLSPPTFTTHITFEKKKRNNFETKNLTTPRNLYDLIIIKEKVHLGFFIFFLKKSIHCGILLRGCRRISTASVVSLYPRKPHTTNYSSPIINSNLYVNNWYHYKNWSNMNKM